VVAHQNGLGPLLPPLQQVLLNVQAVLKERVQRVPQLLHVLFLYPTLAIAHKQQFPLQQFLPFPFFHYELFAILISLIVFNFLKQPGEDLLPLSLFAFDAEQIHEFELRG
jgi:hypothetical protein